MRNLSLCLVLCLIGGAAFAAWNGKRDVSRLAPGMSPTEIQNVNGSCRLLDQIRKSKRLWSYKNEPGEMECVGSDGILRVQFTQNSGPPKSYSIIYYFRSSMDAFDIQKSIETQYGVSLPYSNGAGPMTVYYWQTDTGLNSEKGIGIFLAAPKSGMDYVLRLTDHDLMMSDYDLRPKPPKPPGPKF